MKVYISKFSGFCPGVKQAEEKLLTPNKNRDETIYIYGNLIHNSRYIEFLKKQNFMTINNIKEIPIHKKVVIRTHGIPKEIEEKLKGCYQMIDLTCNTVKNLQLMIQEYSQKGYFILLTGKRNHPEIQGLISYADQYDIIEKEEDIKGFIEHMHASLDKKYDKIFIVSQTTGSLDLFMKTCEGLNKGIQNEIIIETLNSICPITSLREKEALKLQKNVDITFVIGDKMSSNATKLFKILKKNNEKTFFIEDLKGLNDKKLPLKKYKKALLVSSSSTPDFLEKEIREFLEKI